jgi:outer membrane receptor protein involved in Fe transport
MFDVSAQNIPKPQTSRRDTARTRVGVGDMLKIGREKTEPTVFTASRQAQKLSDAPATIYLITDKDIQVRGYLSLKDILDDIPEFKFEEYGNSTYYNDVTVRGIRGQEKFIIMLDGVRISSPTNEAIPIIENYPIRNIKQIEIVTSAASAIYGADAMTGVINIIPYRVDEAGLLRASVYGGRFDYFSTDAMFAKKFKKLEIRLNGQYMRDGQPNFSQFYSGSEFSGMNSLQTGVFNVSFNGKDFIPFRSNQGFQSRYSALRESHNWEASATYQDLNISVHQNRAAAPSSIVYTPNNAITNDDVQLITTVTKFSANYRKTIAKVFNTTILSYSIYELDPRSNYRNLFSGLDKGYKYAHGSMFQLDQQNSFNVNDKLNFSIGINIQSFTSIPRGEDLDQVVDPNFQMQANLLGAPIPVEFTSVRFFNYGAYVQAIYKPTANLIFTAGGRYDYNTRFEGVFNPRIGGTLKIGPNSSFKLFYGSSFLAPSSFEMNQRFGSFSYDSASQTFRSSFRQIPNPDLKPIRMQSVEASFYQAVGSFKVNFTAYHLWVSDLFLPRGYVDTTFRDYGYSVGFLQQTINADRQRNYGFTVTANYRIELDKTTSYNNVYAGIGYIEGVVEKSQETQQRVDIPIGYVSNWQFRLGNDIVWQKWSLSVRMIAMDDQRTKALNNFTATNSEPKRITIPGYVIFNLNAGYQVLKNVRLSAQVQNLTDIRYRNVNSSAYQNPYEFRGTPQAPFRVMGGIHVSI